MSDSPPTARPTALDVFAAAVSRLTPRALHPRIDAVRHDVRRMVRAFTTPNTRPFHASSDSAPSQPPPLDKLSVIESLLPPPLAERYAVIARDVRVMTGSLRGERPAVTVKLAPRREPTPTEGPAASAASEPSRGVHPRTVRVVSVRRETAEATTFVLEDPTGARFDFVPGQFVTVLVDIAGEPHRRAYSLSSVPAELPRFAITVKRVAGGLVSNHLNDHVREGDSLAILGPSGSFTLDGARGPEGAAPERLWLFAGGSGITPIYSILREFLSTTGGRAHLVYGSRARESVIFREALDALGREHGERFEHTPVLESQDPYAKVTGRLDPDTSATVCEVLEVPADAQCFVCGPEPMMDAVRGALLARGVARENVREERFTSPQRRTQESPVSRGGHTLTVRQRGKTRAIVTRPDQSLLEAGLEAGFDMPFSCTMGGCGACKSKLVSGSVDMVEPNCLSEGERADGDVLTCVACTSSDSVVEVP